MGKSLYVERLREKLGHTLLLLPGVAALIRNEQGNILLERLSEESRWTLPAGGIDPGESPREAIIREVYEETGLEIHPMYVIGVFGGERFRHTYANGDEIESTSIIFACSILGGSLREQPSETSTLEFVEPLVAADRISEYPRELFTDNARREAFFV